MRDDARRRSQILHGIDACSTGAGTGRPNAQIFSSVARSGCYGAGPVRRLALPFLFACVGWFATVASAAEGLDVLEGRAGSFSICSLTPGEATEVFGIPSRNVAGTDGFIMEFSHQGLVLEFSDASAQGTLRTLTVFAVDRDGYVGYRGHFLGTVASGTQSAPIRRLLRLARAEIARDEPDLVHARLQGFELEIGFVYDRIDWARLACAPSAGRASL